MRFERRRGSDPADEGDLVSSEAATEPVRERRRLRFGWKNLSYTSRVTLAFAAIAAMTALVAIGVVSFVWEQHFQTYTTENMRMLAQSTAERISANCASEAASLLPAPPEGEDGAEVPPTAEVLSQSQINDILRNAAQDPVKAALATTSGIGVQVVNNEVYEQVLYDSSWAVDEGSGGSSGKTLAPRNAEYATANVVLDNQIIGSVRIWTLR